MRLQDKIFRNSFYTKGKYTNSKIFMKEVHKQFTLVADRQVYTCSGRSLRLRNLSCQIMMNVNHIRRLVVRWLWCLRGKPVKTYGGFPVCSLNCVILNRGCGGRQNIAGVMPSPTRGLRLPGRSESRNGPTGKSFSTFSLSLICTSPWIS